MDGNRRREASSKLTEGPSRRTVLRGFASGGAAAALLTIAGPVRAAAQAAAPSAEPEQGESGVAIVVLFGEPADPAAFEEYYLETHIPLTLTIPHLQRLEGGRSVGTLSGEAAPYYRVAELHFADRTAMEAALASPEGQAAFADVPNFATGGITAFVADEVTARPGPATSTTPSS